MNELKIEDIKKVLILGSGTLGLRVGLQAAISGFDVCIYDLTDEILTSTRVIQGKLLKSLTRNGIIEESQIQEVLSRISYTTDPKIAAQNTDFINESVTEDINIKQQVWKQFGELCSRHTIFTTNTSFLLPSMFADFSGRPERFCAFHFHDVFVANVVDIMPHQGTAQWVIDLLFEMGKKLRQTPVLIKKESQGYIFNYILMHILTSSGSLLANEIGTIHDIDRSWMGNFKTPIGPFGMLDQIGLDTAWHVSKNSNTPKSLEFATLLKTYIDQGKLGIKTGEGFYTYPNPEYQKEDFVI
ncbi:3-hydroxyacyl-CoA dehydrogenase NAD-binding domain-containing protein [Reichenbachiella sp. MALMAid0571]|uniref:3-hydroxyacyl-CoA dehydrogenase NAD-binding domain-containing protein n=1 Tax=Reichenbachiella sp. MALMAid0571 TaxID=3143939 RepID=UPI0032DF4320